MTPGAKFNDWELHGVPVRLELGPKDIEKNSVVAARRDIPGRDGKQFLSQDGLVASVNALLTEIQAHLLTQARAFRDGNIHDVKSYDELKQVIENGGWARGYWAGSPEDEARTKTETGATHRCFPFDQPGQGGVCLMTGQQAEKMALFAKAY
jgi:prolyl-tRNA synthetase